MCNKIRKYPQNYFSKTVDLIMDNKSFDIPTTQQARENLQKKRIGFYI